MSKQEAIEIVTQHQRWRIGVDEDYKYTPRQITEALNIVLEIAIKSEQK
jgi:hypothetical protein